MMNLYDENLEIGTIIEVDGNHIVVEMSPDIKELTKVYGNTVFKIGQFGSIIKCHFANKLQYMIVHRLRMKSEYNAEKGISSTDDKDSRILEAELFGEAEFNRLKMEIHFERGISSYPLPLQKVYLTTVPEREEIYQHERKNSIKIGTYVGEGDIPCYTNINELFNKHTAILGSTGSGKSAAVAGLVHSVIEYKRGYNVKNWHPHIVILDVHNEYSNIFNHGVTLSTYDQTLRIPHWIFNLDELFNLLVNKSPSSASKQYKELKSALLECRIEGNKNIGLDENDVTVDTPIPYSLGTLLSECKNDDVNQSIEKLMQDRRFDFITKDIGDEDLVAIISQFVDFENSIKIIDISGIPNEVAGTLSSCISNMLFNYKLWQNEAERGQDPIVFICEEAHRYVPNSSFAEYKEARKAIQTIAKEGRKYGLGIVLVTQRPSELDTTILSQCNTWIVLRLTNSADKEHVSNFLPDSLTNLKSILSSLRRSEAIFIGTASTIPARIKLRQLKKEELPLSSDINFVSGWQSDFDSEVLQKVIKRWRTQNKNSD